MNLDLVPLGWVHSIACLAAIVLALLVLARPKGTAVHKLRGRIYAGAMLIVSLTALAIYRRGIVFFPHWLAIVVIVAMAAGLAAAHFKVPASGWVHLHLTSMLATVYLLIGGGVNEAFLRIDMLRRLAPNLNSPIVGETHLAVMTLFALLLAYFNAKMLMRRRAAGTAGSTKPPTSERQLPA
jgi:uncharacterized membrane protein